MAARRAWHGVWGCSVLGEPTVSAFSEPAVCGITRSGAPLGMSVPVRMTPIVAVNTITNPACVPGTSHGKALVPCPKATACTCGMAVFVARGTCGDAAPQQQRCRVWSVRLLRWPGRVL